MIYNCQVQVLVKEFAITSGGIGKWSRRAVLYIIHLKLHTVNGTALFKTTEADIWLESTGPNAVWRILGSTGGNTHRFRIYDNTNGKEPFYIEGSSGSNTQHVHVNSGNLVFDASGTGIDFSATSDASGSSSELLDDYEEGSFTITAAPQSGTMTFNNSYNQGTYTKIGNTVHIQAYLSVSF